MNNPMTYTYKTHALNVYAFDEKFQVFYNGAPIDKRALSSAGAHCLIIREMMKHNAQRGTK